jgi:hypothetical protein
LIDAVAQCQQFELEHFLGLLGREGGENVASHDPQGWCVSKGIETLYPSLSIDGGPLILKVWCRRRKDVERGMGPEAAEH